jgi:PPOX class probable F420-dependent enzyme
VARPRSATYIRRVGIRDAKYVLLTTFKRDGTPVSTPVWNVPLGDREMGFWTSSGSGKAKRLTHTQRVTVQPCDARGRPSAGTEPVEATARLVTGAELDEIRRKVVDKYGRVMTTITKWLGSLGGLIKRKRIPYGDRGVVITLPE